MIVSFQPQEEVISRPNDLGGLPDFDGQMFKILATDPLVFTLVHRLDREPSVAFPSLKEGQTDVWFTDVTKTQITVHRSAGVAVQIIVA